MKCVVTGGSGFIGSFITEELAKEGHEVIIFDIARPQFKLPPNVEFVEGNTLYPELLNKVITKDTDEVYDLAGVLGTSELMFDNPRAVDTNIHGAVNVLDACKNKGVKRVFHPTKPNDWLNTYSITKFAAEQLALMYQKNFNMDISILKWFNAYGPRQHLYPIRKVIPLFVIQATNNLPIEIFGDGEQTVDLIYVEDIAKIAIEATRKCGKLGKILDVGSGIPLKVNELAQKIIRLCNSKSEIIHLPMRYGEPVRSQIKADTVELRKYIQFNEFTDLDIGLKKTAEYYKNIHNEEQERALRHFKIRDKSLKV